MSKAWCDTKTDEKVAFIGGKDSGLGGVFLEEEAIEDRDQVHGSRGIHTHQHAKFTQQFTKHHLGSFKGID